MNYIELYGFTRCLYCCLAFVWLELKIYNRARRQTQKISHGHSRGRLIGRATREISRTDPHMEVHERQDATQIHTPRYQPKAGWQTFAHVANFILGVCHEPKRQLSSHQRISLDMTAPFGVCTFRQSPKIHIRSVHCVTTMMSPRVSPPSSPTRPLPSPFSSEL